MLTKWVWPIGIEDNWFGLGCIKHSDDNVCLIWIEWKLFGHWFIASRLSELRSCVVSVLCSVISATVSKLRPMKLPVFFPAGRVLWACSTPSKGRPRIALPRGLARSNNQQSFHTHKLIIHTYPFPSSYSFIHPSIQTSLLKYSQFSSVYLIPFHYILTIPSHN